MSQNFGSQSKSEKAAMDGISSLGDSNAASLSDKQRFLPAKQLLNDGSDLKGIQLLPKSAVDKGFLSKLGDGKYKIKETARRKRSRSRSRSRKPGSKRRSRSRKRSGSKRRSPSGRRRRKRSGSRRRRSRRSRKAADENQ